MVHVIQIFMLLAGALIVIFTKTDAGKISKNEIFRSGMIALVAVFGDFLDGGNHVYRSYTDDESSTWGMW